LRAVLLHRMSYIGTMIMVRGIAVYDGKGMLFLPDSLVPADSDDLYVESLVASLAEPVLRK
jgi:hypothetical protein